jgi:hypothetical protein
MPFYPAAHVALLPEATTQKPITPRLVVLHTNAGASSTSPQQLWNYMARADVNVECTFDVAADGQVWQMMPCNVRADCNAQANDFAVSIETQDNGAATLNSTPWTPAQCDSIVALLAWLADTYAIPMWRCGAWNGSGVGAHRDFPEWSSAAHSCPGDARFAQVDGLIAAAIHHRQPDLPPLLPPTFTQTQPVGRVPLYTEETAMADPYRITSPQYQTQLLRWPSGALGWCSHAEAAKYPMSVEEGDPATFLALVGACTVPPVPQGQVIPT